MDKTLRLWEVCSLGIFKKMLDGAIERFEHSNPGVKIERANSLCDLYNLQLIRATESGDLPDIFHTWGGKMLKDMIEKGEVYDLTDELKDGWAETFIPSLLNTYRFKKRTYAVPVAFGWIFFYYNKEIFDRFRLSPPEDFDELLDTSKFLRKQGIIPISLGNKEGWEGDFFFTYLANRIAGDELIENIVERNPGYSFSDKSIVEAGHRIQQMVDAGAFPDDFNNLGYFDQRNLFWEEKAAMQLNGNRLLSKYLDIEAPHMLDKIDIFHFPKVSGGKGELTTAQGSSQLSFAVLKNCENIKEALGFLHEVTGDVMARDVILKAGDIPARRNSVSSENISQIYSKVIDELNNVKKIQVHFFRSLPPSLSRAHIKILRSIFAKDISPEQASSKLEEEATKLDNQEQ